MSGKIESKLQAVQQHIREIAEACGRNPETITLIAVSKLHPASEIQEAIACGHRDFGENRVQELCEKQELMKSVRWHMIGNLQRNKVRFISPFVHLIHSVDSEKLLQVIEKEAWKQERVIPVLLQIFISGEDTKSGMSPEEAHEIISRYQAYPHIAFKGVMGMAALTEDRELIRTQFRHLASVFANLQTAFSGNHSFTEISMGMSGDYDIAIEEGATLIRVGSAIFQ
jgi:pyridoxal phosphate enzyme (YggS family)